jgi:hypothetical protein
MSKMMLLFAAHFSFVFLLAQQPLPAKSLTKMPMAKDSLRLPVERRTSLSTFRNSGKNILVLASSARSTKDQDVSYLGKLQNKDVYKVSVSAIVSKYAGETEKNLEAVFNAAQRNNSILFFDQADSLFSKSNAPESTINYINKLAQSKNVQTVFWCEEDCLTWFQRSKHEVIR